MLRTASLSSLFLAVLGCNQPAAEKPLVSPTSCEEFSERVCAYTSHVSPVCKSLKKAAELYSPEMCAEALTSVDVTLRKVDDKVRDCTQLTERLCTDLGRDSKGCATVQSTSKSYPNDRCQQMLAAYAETLDGIKKRTEGPAPLAGQDKLSTLATAVTSLAFGPADAKVTVVALSDFQDPMSARTLPTIKAIKAKYGERVRFVFRQFSQEKNGKSHVAAQAALAAQAQDKFWEFYNVTFDNQSQLSRDALERYATQVGLNLPKFKKALDDKAFSDAVDGDIKLAREAGIPRAPALLVNGQPVANPFDPAAVEQTIEAGLKAGS